MEHTGEEDWVLVPHLTDAEHWGPTTNVNENDVNSQPLKIVFTEPAKHWTDALPIGNGRLGAMVWGGVPSETLQLNESTLWTGVPGDYTNAAAPEALAQVRELVDKGKYPEATEAAFKLSDIASDVYQPLCDIRLDFNDSHVAYDAKTYQRELDLESATVNVKYTVGDVVFTREHFISNPHQVIVTKISASKPGSLSFTVSLDSKLHHDSIVNAEHQIIMEGSCRGNRLQPKEGTDDNPKGIQFTAVLGLQISEGAGVVQVLDDKKLRVEGSDWAILLLVASSTFDGPFTKPEDSKKVPTAECLAALSSVKHISYSDLYAHHLLDYQKLFQRVSLRLSKSSKSVEGDKIHTMRKQNLSRIDRCIDKLMGDLISTAERVKSFKTDEDPSLVELLFQYGRYLLISSSRPGTQPSNLQGIWNKDVEPAWDCAPHLNINLQMNYWPSLCGNLRECQEPLFDYISVLSVNGSKTARVNYECGGWVAHQVSDIWAKTSPDRGDPVWALWPMGGAWLCTHMWEHFTYTMDKTAINAASEKLGKDERACTANQRSFIPFAFDTFGFLVPDWGELMSMYLGELPSLFRRTRGAACCTLVLYISEFLEKKAYPMLEGCASFLVDWLIAGHGEYLETNPSTSPEHRFIAPDGKQASVSYSTTMDMAIIREIFSEIISAAEILGRKNDSLIGKVQTALPKLYPTKIGREGTILEWAEDFQDPEVTHRHVSHLFGLFPGHTITVEKTPDLCKAATNSLHKRGEEGPGWSTMWKTALWARLHNSERSYQMVKHLINWVDPDHEADYEGGLYSNLFTAHPPFQIDANFGFTAAISEMLVQSTMTDLYLLPALPRNKWANGAVKGLKARGGLTVNISWKEDGLHQVGLWSQNENSLTKLHYNGMVVSTKIAPGNIYTFDNRLKCLKKQAHLGVGF